MQMTDRSRCIGGKVLTRRRRRLEPGILWVMTQCGLVDSTKVSGKIKHANGSKTFVWSLCSCSKHDVTQQEMVAAFRSDKGCQLGKLWASTELHCVIGMPSRLLKAPNRPLFIKISDVAHWDTGSWNSDSLLAGRSVVRTSVFAKFSVHAQTGPLAYPLSCTMDIGSLPRDKAAGTWRGPNVAK
jgi:hypothetical protein